MKRRISKKKIEAILGRCSKGAKEDLSVLGGVIMLLDSFEASTEELKKQRACLDEIIAELTDHVLHGRSLNDCAVLAQLLMSTSDEFMRDAKASESPRAKREEVQP